jgi:hypothetical protein
VKTPQVRHICSRLTDTIKRQTHPEEYSFVIDETWFNEGKKQTQLSSPISFKPPRSYKSNRMVSNRTAQAPPTRLGMANGGSGGRQGEEREVVPHPKN